MILLIIEERYVATSSGNMDILPWFSSHVKEFLLFYHREWAESQ